MSDVFAKSGTVANMRAGNTVIAALLGGTNAMRAAGKAYCRLTGQRMQRWELNLLAIFDTAFLDVMQKEEPEVKEGLDNAETDV